MDFTACWGFAFVAVSTLNHPSLLTFTESSVAVFAIAFIILDPYSYPSFDFAYLAVSVGLVVISERPITTTVTAKVHV